MLTAEELIQACQREASCPAQQLAREGQIDLPTYAQHRIEHKREQPSESTDGYIPVPEKDLAYAEQIIADLRNGTLTGFALVAVGPETSGAQAGFSGGRMDRMQLLGNLAMMRRRIEDLEQESD